jgi:DNA polymerase (family X)
MTTAAISDLLDLTALLMELHGENSFKSKALKNAAYRIYKLNPNLAGKSLADLEVMEGIGKSIGAKILEMQQTGSTQELRLLMDKTPPGILEVLKIKGLGPKKVSQLWKELGIESIGELQYACNENRLVDLKGFGEKTQQSILENIVFLQVNQGKFHYARIIEPALKAVEALQLEFNTEKVSLTGEIYRKCEIIDKISILIAAASKSEFDTSKLQLPLPVELIFCTEENYFNELVRTSSVPEHLSLIGFQQKLVSPLSSEEEVYKSLGFHFVNPELREGLFESEVLKNGHPKELITMNDLKGALHNHSTYSDGQHSIEQMALRCKEMGLTYFGIADHSQSAYYAGGLKLERIAEQHREIDALNKKLSPFRIFKGIESDILPDGSLDYDKDVLATFDYVVASVHSNLKMSEEKAMERLIKAIENPYTTILGHPTGRLLLSRPGYPLDHKKIIDACAANGVVIELNAHPYRLDIDWRWIPYCMEKGVMISINPDAHHQDGLSDMYYGVCAARKGTLTAQHCLNALNLEQITNFFAEGRR